MRRAGFVLCVAAAALALPFGGAPEARAEAPAAAFKASADLRALPEAKGGEPEVPAAPKAIPAGEQVAGVWAAAPKVEAPAAPARAKEPAHKARKKRKKQHPKEPSAAAPALPVTVVAGETVDAALERVDRGPFTHQLRATEGRAAPWGGACVVARTRASGQDLGWSSAGEVMALVPKDREDELSVDGSEQRSGGDEGVRLVRVERVVPGAAGKAALERTYAWVDVRSRGVRLLARRAIPLALVHEAPGGLAVYAYREADAAKGDAAKGDTVTFIVRRPPAAETGEQPGLQSLDDGGGDCTHVSAHVTVDVAGGGETTTIDGVLAMRDPDRDKGTLARPFHLALSAAWLSRDEGPVVSSAFGWTGKPRRDGP